MIIYIKSDGYEIPIESLYIFFKTFKIENCFLFLNDLSIESVLNESKREKSTSNSNGSFEKSIIFGENCGNSPQDSNDSEDLEAAHEEDYDRSIDAKSDVNHEIIVQKEKDEVLITFLSTIKRVNEQDAFKEIKNRIAMILGYNPCICTGFAVKDKNKNKIFPEETIYIHNTIEFKTPLKLQYSKQKEVPDIFRSRAEFITESKILLSIIGNNQMCFKTDDDIYLCKKEGDKLVIQCDNENYFYFSEIERSKVENLNDFFARNRHKYIEILKDIYINCRDKRIKRTIIFNKANERDKRFFEKFLEIVPHFGDFRDKTTKFIYEVYHKSQNTIFNVSKGNYLNIRRKFMVERLPLNSLKRFFYKD